MVNNEHRGPFRVVFFGTPDFAVEALDALLQSSHSVVGVVTRPDRPKGRGHRLSETPVKLRALAADLPVLQPERLSDEAFLAALEGFGADLGVVAAYGKILTDRVLALPRLGLLNVHASLLPSYRGAAPVHRAIINGERETGVTIMRVAKGLDTGPMLASKHHPIGPDETSEEVERSLAKLGASLLIATLDQMVAGTVKEVVQDDSAATYAHRLTKDEGVIDWTQPSTVIHNLIRGLHPWPHAFTFHRGRRLILLRSRVVSGSADPPGTIVEAAGDRFHVAAGQDLLAIVTVQAEGTRPMTSREFLAGHPMAVGERLTPRR
jgi:methionyl-tRNA formyltransferase